MMKEIELLAPAGDMEKLKTALYFGADAVYFAGKQFGLRAFSNNFENIKQPIEYTHKLGKKAYVTVNIYAKNDDFAQLENYLKEIEGAGADGIIVSDMGVMALAKKVVPNLDIHVSTQANTTNKYSAESFVKNFGATRIVLARELSLKEIEEIASHLKDSAEIEVFVHGAMCISYSGRCLLSNYLTGRDSNRGECVQACRWNYSLLEKNRDQEFDIQEDPRGTYIMNSKDMCMIEHLDKIIGAGVSSLKIEGRMKSPYYVATVVNAYKRALMTLKEAKSSNTDYKVPDHLLEELQKASHRQYTTGFMVDEGDIKQNYKSAAQSQNAEFIAMVVGVDVAKSQIIVEQRNRFKVGDTLEVLSPSKAFMQKLVVQNMHDERGKIVEDAKNVQQILCIEVSKELSNTINAGDILRSCK